MRRRPRVLPIILILILIASPISMIIAILSLLLLPLVLLAFLLFTLILWSGWSVGSGIYSEGLIWGGTITGGIYLFPVFYTRVSLHFLTVWYYYSCSAWWLTLKASVFLSAFKSKALSRRRECGLCFGDSAGFLLAQTKGPKVSSPWIRTIGIGFGRRILL